MRLQRRALITRLDTSRTRSRAPASRRARTRPVALGAALDALSPGGGDGLLNTAPDGRWLVLSTERFGCAGWACLTVVHADLRAGAAVRTPAGVIHPEGFVAIASGDALVV
ncbi:MAG: hypothetical protein ABI990_02625 [Actinomycetota bacterium]